MGRMENKVVIVTGGGSGIGRATCEVFAEEGAHVVVADINEAAGQQTVEAITASGGHATFQSTNIADEESVQRMAAEVDEQFGRIDVLVNNAAVFVLSGIEASVAQWRQSLDTNVIGTALVSKHVVPIMRRNPGGAIVNLGSISSFIAQPEFVTYNATKAAISEMTRCMALDLAQDKIRVNAVCPGTVWSPIVERLTREAGLTREQADTAEGWGGDAMLQRLADPREIAYAILFLASDEASYITAENLMVDGGFTAR